MARKHPDREDRYYEVGPPAVCTDCGMQIDPEIARFRHADSSYAHADTEYCIEGHGED